MISLIRTYWKQRINLWMWLGVSGYLCLLIYPFSEWSEMLFPVGWVLVFLVLLRWWDDLWHFRKDRSKPHRVYTEAGKQLPLWVAWGIFFLFFIIGIFYRDASLAWWLLIIMFIQFVHYAIAFWRKQNTDFLPILKYGIIYLSIFSRKWEDVFQINSWVLLNALILIGMAKWVEWKIDHPNRNNRIKIFLALLLYLFAHQYYYYVSTPSAN